MAQDTVLVEFKAEISEFKARLKEIENALGGVDKSVDKVGGRIGRLENLTKQTGDGFKQLGLKIAGAFTVVTLIDRAAQAIRQFAVESVKAAASAEGVEKAFKALNKPGLLDSLRDATRGTVTDLQLMQAAVKAQNFKVPLENLAEFFEFATKRANQTGESVDFLVESIINGIGRKSSLVLDNLGISASELQAEMAKVGDFGKAAGNIISRELGKAGDVAGTSAEKITRFSVTIENLKKRFGDAILNIIGFKDSTNGLSSAFTEANTKFESQGAIITPLVERYKELTSGIVLNKEQQIELNGIMAQLQKQIPGTALEFDKYGNVISVNTNKVIEFLKQQEKLNDLRTEDEFNKQIKALRGLSAEIITANSNLQVLASGRKLEGAFAPKSIEEATKNLGQFKIQAIDILDNIDQLGRSVTDVQDVRVQNLLKSVVEISGFVSKSGVEAQKAAAAEAAKLKSAVERAKLIISQGADFTEEADKISLLRKEITELGKELKREFTESGKTIIQSEIILKQRELNALLKDEKTERKETREEIKIQFAETIDFLQSRLDATINLAKIQDDSTAKLIANANAEIAKINETTQQESDKSLQIVAIGNKLNNDLKALDDKRLGDFVNRGESEIEENKKANKQRIDDDIKADLERKAKRDAIIEQSFQLAQQLSNSIVSLSVSRADQEIAQLNRVRDAELNNISEQERALNQSRDRREISQREFEDRVNELRLNRIKVEEDISAKLKIEQTKRARAEKAGAIFSASINLAQAIVAALKTPFLIPFISALGALQLATILATPIPQFEKGGEVGGKRHSKGGTLIEAEQGEFVHTRDSVSKYKDYIKSIHNDKLEDLIFMKHVIPALREQKKRFQEQSFASNVAASLGVSGNDNIEMLLRGGLQIRNADELGKAIAKHLRNNNDPYRA